MSSNAANNVFENTILLAVNIEGLGRTRKVSLDNVEVDADKDRLNLASKILQCPERARISGLFTALRNAISDDKRGLALPGVYKRSVYVLPRASVARTDKMLREYQETLRGLVSDLEAVYEQRIAEDRLKLREKFSEKHYPAKSSLQETFQIKWRYMSLSPSTELQSISSDIYQQEVERVTAEVRTMGEEVKATLREAAYQLVAHLHSRLGMDDEGKPKVFKGAAVRNLVAFLETFDTKNIMGDAELSSVLNQLKGLLQGVEPKELRTDEALRAAVRGSLEAKLPTLETLVVSAGRYIELPDDEPEAPASVVAAADEYGPNPGDMEPDMSAPVENCKKHRKEQKPCQKCKAESKARSKKAAA